MENIQNKNNTASVIEEEPSPELCVSCLTFYSNPETGKLCSGCFKKQPQEITNKKKPVVEVIANTSKKEEISEKQSKCKQKNQKRCWGCKKRVGLLGFKCKCEYTFCRKHRLPEYHECDFDFKALGKLKLKEENQTIKKDKMNHI